MDRSSFRKKVILDLVSSPWTMVPVAGGLSLLMSSWAMGGGADWLAFLGVSGLLAGVGALFTRWIFRSDKIARDAFEALQAEAQKEQERTLDDLDKRLRQDKDPRPEACLEDLRSMYDAFRKNNNLDRRLGHQSAIEITNKVEKLFRSCILSLERSHELWKTSREMKTSKARDALCEERERTVEEILASTKQMAKSLDEIQAMLVVQKHDERQLAQIRQELDESLEVARRVEQRMQSLEDELGGHIAQAEKE